MVLNISKFSSVFFLIYIYSTLYKNRSFPGGSNGKESACNAGDMSLIPGSGRSPGEGNGHPHQYFCLENLHGQRSLAGYGPQGHKESDTTEGTEHRKRGT